MLLNRLKKRKTTGGFTLIELLVFLSLFVLIGMMAIGFLLTSLSGGGKVEITKEVRQNGSFILSTIETTVRSAVDIECSVNPDPPELTVKNRLGEQAIFSCNNTTQTIASNGATMNNPSVAVDLCSFTCLVTPGQPKTAQIFFRVSQVGVSSRVEDKATVQFETAVSLRNSIN